MIRILGEEKQDKNTLHEACLVVLGVYLYNAG